MLYTHRYMHVCIICLYDEIHLQKHKAIRYNSYSACCLPVLKGIVWKIIAVL